MDRHKDSRKLNVELIEKIYDVIRYVNPIVKSDDDQITDFKINESDTHCYSFWQSNEVCKNCISMRALNENKVTMKFEYSCGKLFMVTAVPEKENNRVLELIRDVSNDHLLDNIDGLSEDLIIDKIVKLNKEIITDPLTGLYNRRFLDERMPFEIAKAYANKLSISVIMGDIDHFKDVNDNYGHVVGDQVIKEFSDLLMLAIRDYDDWIVRFGGEEFLIFLFAIDKENLIKRIEKIRENVESHVFCSDEYAIKVTASFGIYTNSEIKKDDLDKGLQFIHFADEALYLAKENGRNRCELYKLDGIN